jgi:hypothetical protein
MSRTTANSTLLQPRLGVRDVMQLYPFDARKARAVIRAADGFQIGREWFTTQQDLLAYEECMRARARTATVAAADPRGSRRSRKTAMWPAREGTDDLIARLAA